MRYVGGVKFELAGASRARRLAARLVLSWGQTLSVALLLLSGCEAPETQKIVIPPGGQVQYNTSEFVYYSDDKYQVYLRKVLPTNGMLETIFNVTPPNSLLLDGSVNHSTIVPKGLILSGMLVLQVDMEYHDTTLYSFVFDENPVQPSLESTLVYELLSNYPNRLVQDFTRGEIEVLQDYVNQLVEDRIASFGLSRDMNPDLLYKFLRNSLSNNPEFFALAATVGVDFSHDVDGNVLAPPYPFGRINNPPYIDEFATTAAGAVNGMESVPLTVTAEARDSDGDLLFYVWRQDGQVVLQNLQQFYWLPDFDDGRPAPYDLEVLISDGGRVIPVQWDLFIQDVNRKPLIFGICSTSLIEGQPWFCDLRGEDPDFDPLLWSLADAGFSTKPTLRNLTQGTPAVQAGAGTVSAVTEDFVRLEWTPDNADARVGSGSLSLRLDDGKLGLEFRIVSVSVTDINSPPFVVGGGITPTNPLHDPAREYDACLGDDPDTNVPGPGLGQLFTFEVIVQDPDNLAGATPPDLVNVSISGSLGSTLTANGSTVETVPVPQTVFSYTWRPTHMLKAGNLFVNASDDHGGTAPLLSVPVVAEDRNQMACWGPAAPQNATLSDQSYFQTMNNDGIDQDIDPPYIEYRGIPWPVASFVRDCSTPEVYYNWSKRFNRPGPAISRLGSGEFCVSAALRSPYAGTALLQRAVVYGGGDIIVPEGFVVRTDFPANAMHRIEWEVAEAATLTPDMEYLSVPLRAINRTAPPGTLVIMEGPASSDPTITVSNLAPVSGSIGTVRFSRAVGGTDATIPNGMLVRTDESLFGNTVHSIQYLVTDNYVMPAAATFLDVQVVRQTIVVPPTAIRVLSAPLADASVTVSNPANVMDHEYWEIYPFAANGSTLGVDRFEFVAHLFDGASTAVNEVTRLTTPLSDPTVTLTNAVGFQWNGQVQFSRTDTTNPLVIPAGYTVRSPNGKRYTLDAAVLMTPAQSTANGNVTRVLDPGPIPTRPMVIRFEDRNTPPSFNSGASTIVVEGNDLLGFPIEATDNMAFPMLPQESFERYTFSHAYIGQAPTGTVALCRTPAVDSPNLFNGCTPCTSTAGLSHHQARKCYIRYRHSTDDIANGYTFQVTVNDNGHTFPVGTNIRLHNISITVQEINDAPVFTYSDFVPPGTPIADSTGNPVDLGDFVEGNSSTYNFFLKDPDKTTDFRTIQVATEPNVWDVALGAWVPKPPGLTTAIQNINYSLPGGIGSETTARITWNPTDQEAKQFSSNEGFIVRVRANDAPANPGVRQTVYGHFLVRVKNRNNPPEFMPIGANNKFTWLADGYYSQDFTVRDVDAYTPLGGWGAFSPYLTTCQDANGTNLVHSSPPMPGLLSLDSPEAPYQQNCHGVLPHWPIEPLEYDPAYDGNLLVDECRLVPGGALDPSLAVPRLTMIDPPHQAGAYYVAGYRLEWCPQRGQLGTHRSTLYVNDAGDKGRNGDLSLKAAGSTPLELTVQAPVFFVSPRMAGAVPDHYMEQSVSGLSLQKFRYETLVNNSKGNPLEYTILVSPRACGLQNGVCIGAPGETPHGSDPPRVPGVDVPGVITWLPRYTDPDGPGPETDDMTAPYGPGPAGGHLIRIRVRDTVTLETDTVEFNLKIQDPVVPTAEATPIISGTVPGTGPVVSVQELETASFSVTATDANVNDVLHYRWYVDNVLKADEGPAFSYRPDLLAGSADPDGVAGPLKPGEHVVKCVVTDGGGTATVSWNLKVKNVYLVPESVFDVATARGGGVANINWTTEDLIHTTAGPNNQDFLVFTGSYLLAPFTRNFIWFLRFTDGTITVPNGVLSSGNWNRYELLPWVAGEVSERISYYWESENVFNAVLTPKFARTGPHTNTMNSVKLKGDLTALPSTLTSAYQCAGACPTNHYAGVSGYGRRPTASYIFNGNNVFWATDTGNNVMWDRNGAPAVGIFPGGMVPTDTVYGLGVNTNSKRLYVTTQSQVAQRYRLHVFNIAPVETSNPPVYLTSIDIFDGTNIDSMPTDILVDSANNRAFIYLAGTGGIAVLQDPAPAVPASGDISFVGVMEISSSQTDTPSSGRRMAYDTTNGMLYGISRLGRQVFSIDTGTWDVNVLATDRNFNTILTLPASNLTVVVDRPGAAVFRVR
ncbi:MAG: hypothetical protein IT285_02435 [Bdellovibrionales bacterium]|nr:hypothetical protein [Bdellovibrionales bacterium]